MDIPHVFTLITLDLYTHREARTEKNALYQSRRRPPQYRRQYPRDPILQLHRISMGDSRIADHPPRTHNMEREKNNEQRE